MDSGYIYLALCSKHEPNLVKMGFPSEEYSDHMGPHLKLADFCVFGRVLDFSLNLCVPRVFAGSMIGQLRLQGIVRRRHKAG